MIKTLIKVVPLLFILPLMTGCLPQDNTKDPFEVGQILDKQDGFYILSDGICTPVVTPTEVSSELITRLYANNEVSFTLVPEDREHLPEISEGEELILKCKSSLETPVMLVPLREDGYSLGLKLERNGDSFSLRDVDGVIKGSKSEEALKEVSGLNQSKVLSVGSSVLKADSVSQAGLIKNLNQDSFYDVAFFKGTIETKVTLPADTEVLTLTMEAPVSEPELKYTEEGYGVIETEGLEPGYYLVYLSEPLKTLGGIFKVI